jgi:hypothetical protein
MDFYRIPPLFVLVVSLAICAWLVLRPSAAQGYFAKCFEQQGQPLSTAIAQRLRGTPLWAVRAWGAIAFVFEILIVLAVIFLVN